VRPLLEGAVYKHCVRSGQAECGGIATLRCLPDFKLAFEIESTGKNPILNHR
jgi:hypothetical protein